MLDLPPDHTKVTESLLSHNLRTPLHHLLYAITLLQDIRNELGQLATDLAGKKLIKKNLSTHLTPLAVCFRLALDIFTRQAEVLSNLEIGQDGKPLSTQFKDKLSQIKPISNLFEAARKEQFKLSKDFKKSSKTTITSDLLSIVEKLDKNLTNAKTNLEQVCEAENIPLKFQAQTSGLAVASQSVKVLVVEDDVINRKIFEKILKARGYDYTFAVNGAEAVEKFEIGQFNIILMDIQMPVMDGYEATIQIREKEKEAKTEVRVPIIAVSAVSPKEGRKIAIDVGMDDFLSKPFNEQKIDSLFIKHLIREPLSPASTPESTPKAAYSSLAKRSLNSPSTGDIKSDAPIRSASAPQLQTSELSDNLISSPKSSPLTGQRCNFFKQFSPSENTTHYSSTPRAC